MKNSIILLSILLGSLFQSCSKSPDTFKTEEGIAIRKKVDQTLVGLDSKISDFDMVLRIDHSRLAEEEGVFTPPSIVTIFSNPKVNSKLLRINQLVGIDLPYKVLCYSEVELAQASIAYTSPEFIIKRHGLSQNDVEEFSNGIKPIINSFPEASISTTDLSRLDKNYGLLVKDSDYDFHTTLSNLKNGIMGQGDTEIFGEIDFKEEAMQDSIDIDPTTLILFGAPKPGGKAMHESPKIGLDAFCQKLLVFEKEGKVFVAYNDIVLFAELYYQDWTIPQRIINYRLSSVFEKAIKAE